MLGTLKNMPVVKRTFNRTHCIQGHPGRVLKGFDIISRFRYALRKSPIHMKRVSALAGACSDSVRPWPWRKMRTKLSSLPFHFWPRAIAVAVVVVV